MPVPRFSKRARADLKDIGAYTLRAWGEEQAHNYLADLQAFCRLLASSPKLGRPCENLSAGLRRMQHGKHVVFYLQEEKHGTLVVRILHERMLPHPGDFKEPR